MLQKEKYKLIMKKFNIYKDAYFLNLYLYLLV